MPYVYHTLYDVRRANGAMPRKRSGSSADAWVTYVAYSKFESMATQEMRDPLNAGVPRWTPAVAPSLANAIMRKNVDGVLEVAAHLPDITNNVMHGVPEVGAAFLNGINEAVREEYEGRPLSEMNIPRQVRCFVDGDMPDFTVNIDEHGRQVGALRYRDSAWLRARAAAGSGKTARPEGIDEDVGLDILLGELVTSRIER